MTLEEWVNSAVDDQHKMMRANYLIHWAGINGSTRKYHTTDEDEYMINGIARYEAWDMEEIL